MVEAEKIERAFQFHLLVGVVVGEFLDPNRHPAELRPELGGDGFQRGVGERLDVGGAGRRQLGIDHGATIARLARRTKLGHCSDGATAEEGMID